MSSLLGGRLRNSGAVYPTSARGVMWFHLVYNGPLRASGNSAKFRCFTYSAVVQPTAFGFMGYHPASAVLKNTGARKPTKTIVFNDGGHRYRSTILPEDYEDLIMPIYVGGCHYLPLVRKSLDLSCELQIMFLRQQDPGELISQGGDIDTELNYF